MTNPPRVIMEVSIIVAAVNYLESHLQGLNFALNISM